MFGCLSSEAQAQDQAAGKALFATCAACHGAAGEGNKDLNAPAIAGQEKWYLVRQLQNFKSGVRGAHPKDATGSQMAPMAMTLATEADVGNVAAYVSSLPVAPLAHDGGGDAAAGKALYATCAACHGPDGKGQEATNAPNLTIQQDWYVLRQIQHFKAGVRGADAKDTFGQQMAPMAQTLADDAAAKNIVAYLASLR
jgi:cytochrome c oxidase subunit 2